ncbi:hypothetical protein [Burkholderia cepacia]|uniref:hypothetical protein n=1 Tax=Burkholderia cepacia TaxID=292 RepID=UPI0015775414|nr:hypothetical protein [Burkholderia cepacia]
MSEPIYKPIEQVAIGQQFIDLDTRARMLRIGNILTGRQPTLAEEFQRQDLHCVALEPGKLLDGRPFPAGQVFPMRRNEAVEVINIEPEHHTQG